MMLNWEFYKIIIKVAIVQANNKRALQELIGHPTAYNRWVSGSLRCTRSTQFCSADAPQTSYTCQTLYEGASQDKEKSI